MTTGHLKEAAIKICGLREPDDVALCLDLGVDFTGFVFVKDSPRYVEAAAAARLPRGGAARVGVFAGQSADEIQRIMDVARLDFAQLHGDESPELCRKVGAERVIKVFWPQRIPDATNADATLSGRLDALCAPFADVCAFFLLDAGTAGGGSGRSLAWTGLEHFCPTLPWLLAGGIGEHNACAALSACRPFGLDCNSALETSPGVKDGARIAALMRSIGREGRG